MSAPDCTCDVRFSLSRSEEIVYCPLHKSAPGLYEALEAYVNHDPYDDPDHPSRWTRGRDALAAARGEQP